MVGTTQIEHLVTRYRSCVLHDRIVQDMLANWSSLNVEDRQKLETTLHKNALHLKQIEHRVQKLSVSDQKLFWKLTTDCV